MMVIESEIVARGGALILIGCFFLYNRRKRQERRNGGTVAYKCNGSNHEAVLGIGPGVDAASAANWSQSSWNSAKRQPSPTINAAQSTVSNCTASPPASNLGLTKEVETQQPEVGSTNHILHRHNNKAVLYNHPRVK